MSGFDPEAYAAGPQSPQSDSAGGFDPSAYAGERWLPPSLRASGEPLIVERPKVGRGEAALVSGLQGITAGWLDEIAGAAQGGGYRDVVREQTAEARKRYPVTSIAAELGGAAMGAGALSALGVARGASAVARGVAGGAAAGAGHSDAESMAGRLAGAAVGGAIGGAAAKVLPALGKRAAAWVGRAPERADKRIVRELVGSANPGSRNRLVGPGGVKAPDVAAVIRESPALRAARGNPSAMREAVAAESATVDNALDELYRAVDATGETIRRSHLNGYVKAFTGKLREKYQPELADAVEKSMASRIEMIKSPFLTATEMRRLVTSVQSAAFEGSAINPSLAKETVRDFAMGLREALNKHVEHAAEKHGLNVGAIRALNKRRSVLANIESVVDDANRRDWAATKIAPFSLDNFERVMKSPTAAVAAVASGNALPYMAARGISRAVKAADSAAARLVAAMRARAAAGRPMPRAEALRRAAELGVAATTAERLVDAAGD